MRTEPRPPLVRRLLSGRLRPAHWIALDVVAALLFGFPLLVLPRHAQVPLYLVGIAVSCAAVALRRRYPLAALAVLLVVLAPWWSSIWVGVWAWASVLYVVAAARPVRTALIALAATLAQPLAGFFWSPWNDAERVGYLAVAGIVLVGSWTLGHTVRQHRAYTAALGRHRAAIEAERARRAVTDERLRIARELHDIVAHSMSVITVQAGFGHLVIDSQPEKARAALGTIETVGRDTLTEMRRLLGVLRADGPASEPEFPGLATLPTLVEQTGRAGVRVELAVTGHPRELPPGVDLSAYRIVQEALTNVVKHAHCPTGRVAIDYGAQTLTIEVTDQGTGHGDTAPGHGLRGMRERVALHGGSLSAAPLPDRGFRVAATLPLPGMVA
jgi:signal transduction histidine kinase